MKKQFIFDKSSLQEMITAKLRSTEMKADEELEFFWSPRESALEVTATVKKKAAPQTSYRDA